MVLWVDGGMMVPHSTHSYNSNVVGFILTTNELLCMRSVLHDMVGMRSVLHDMVSMRNVLHDVVGKGRIHGLPITVGNQTLKH